MLVSPRGRLQVLCLVQPSLSQTRQPTVSEHSRGRALKVVSFLSRVRLVHHQPPAVRLWVLGTLQTVGDSRVVAEQALPAWVLAREQVQDFDQGPDVPAYRAVPNDGSDASLRVGPDGSFALIIAVVEKVGFGVVGDLVDFVPLEDDIVCKECMLAMKSRKNEPFALRRSLTPSGGVVCVEELGVVGIEGVSHEDAV